MTAEARLQGPKLVLCRLERPVLGGRTDDQQRQAGDNQREMYGSQILEMVFRIHRLHESKTGSAGECGPAGKRRLQAGVVGKILSYRQNTRLVIELDGLGRVDRFNNLARKFAKTSGVVSNRAVRANFLDTSEPLLRVLPNAHLENGMTDEVVPGVTVPAFKNHAATTEIYSLPRRDGQPDDVWA